MPTASPTGPLVRLPGVGVEAQGEAAGRRGRPAASPCRPAPRRTAWSRWSARTSRCWAPRPACSPRSRRSSCAPGYVGSACVVAWVSSKQPPWSTAMSTSTEPGFIRETSSLVTSLGALAPGISTAPDHQVGLDHLLLDGQLDGGQPVHPVVVAPEGHPQLVEVGVEQGHVGTHAERDVGGVLAGDAGADDHHLGVGDAADPAHQHPAAALGLQQRVGAHLGRQAAGHLRHRVQQRQPPRGACTVS